MHLRALLFLGDCSWLELLVISFATYKSKVFKCTTFRNSSLGYRFSLFVSSMKNANIPSVLH